MNATHAIIIGIAVFLIVATLTPNDLAAIQQRFIESIMDILIIVQGR